MLHGPIATLGPRLRQLRQAKGLSQRDVENRTGALRFYISRIENGITLPSLPSLQRFAAAYEIPLAEIFADESGEEREAVQAAFPELSERDIQFLAEIGKYSSRLKEDERKNLLSLIRSFAGGLAASAANEEPRA